MDAEVTRRFQALYIIGIITTLSLIFCMWKIDCHAQTQSPMAIIGAPTPGTVMTIQPPVGLPSHAYTNSSGVTQVVPPVGLPSTQYQSGNVTIVQPGVGLPTMIYGTK